MPTETRTLDNAIHAALTGPHAHLAQRRGNALRYPPEVAPFMALPDGPDEADWADLATLAGPGQPVILSAPALEPPAGWTVVGQAPLLQFVDEELAARPDEEAVLLGPADVAEMLDLTARTKPGPFFPRTIEMGRYLGIRRDGRLVAMAGERLRVPGWTEISAVCTDPDARGHGLGTRLVRAVAAGIREHDETPFLHVLESNVNAVRLYRALGFRIRLRTNIFTLAH